MNDTAKELYIWATTSCARSCAAREHMARAYEKRIAQGSYVSDFAVEGLAYAVELAARSYVAEFCLEGEKWSSVFPRADRIQVQKALRDDLETEWRAGNYYGNSAVTFPPGPAR